MDKNNDLRYVEESKFKEKWEKFGSIALIIIMWSMIFFSDSIFGEVYGQVMEGMIVGICSLLYMSTIPSEDANWFGVKNLAYKTFFILGIVNLVITAYLFSTI